MGLSDVQRGFLEKNIIVIDGEVNDQMVSYVKEALAILYSLRKSPDITILISSNGGDAGRSKDIFDYFKQYPGKKKAIVNDAARSAAATILQAADERLLSRHAVVMIHHTATRYVSLDTLRSKKKTEKLREDLEYSQKGTYKILSERSGQGISSIRKACVAAKDMDAEEAIKFGLADSIFEGQLPK